MSEINLRYRYLCAMAAAAAGRNAYFVLVAWIVVDASRSPAVVAVLLAAGSIAEFLTTNLGGSAADRFDRRLTCLVCDIFRLIIMGATFAGLACFDPIPVLVVSWLAYAVVDRTYLTALQALIPSIAAAERLMAFNSMSYIAMQVGNLLAALSTGILLVMVPERFGVLVPLFCFALSFVAISSRSWLVIRETGRKPIVRLRLSDVVPTALPSGPLLTSAAIYALIYAMGMLVNALASTLVIQQLKGTALDFSYPEAAWAAGSVAGCIGLLFLEPRSHRLVSHLALSGFILTGFILLQGLTMTIVQMTMLGVSYNVARVIIDVQVQRSVPSHMLGRARSQIHTLCVAIGLAVYGLIAVVGPGVEPSIILGCFGIVLMTVAFLIFCVSQRRETTAEGPRLSP
ncbi:MFS transporter [Rhizobium tibeticum]|uniref:MFS transporter n=1 Tax=Rhizobium tibeticum TaxID=501024 RepID=UPI001428AC60|nr:MFS transporter [Rhizobium tibeticum]